tara:strand:- start:3579 stop:4181 length:603 start_codon:yes stop_codon:yes gene_type:complete
MKKLVLLAIVATFATSAFAQKGLVELQGCFDGTCDTLDFDMATDKDNDFNSDADDDEESQTIALNYNHLFTDNFGAGLVYIQRSDLEDGDVKSVGLGNSTTTGINLFWNIDAGWMGSYAALRYWMTSVEDTEGNKDGYDSTMIVLEYGKRVALGKVWGLSFAWNPSVSYSMTTNESNTSGSDDNEMTALSISPVNFAVAF